jgi:hypothetical protein
MYIEEKWKQTGIEVLKKMFLEFGTWLEEMKFKLKVQEKEKL